MAVQQESTVTASRRADAGMVRTGDRDIAGLLLCGEQYGAPYDLLAAALDVQPARLRGIVARWRQAGYAATGRLGPGPSWCWLTPRGMERVGLPYPAAPPRLARLAHIRAVLAVFGPDRAAMLAAQLPATTADHAEQQHQQAEHIRKELARIDTAQASLFTELEQLGADDSPATRAYRARIRERHAQHHNDRMSYEQQLTALQATAPQASDPALLDELPQAAALFDQAPEHIKEQLCAAFDIQVLYRDDRQQATIWATITDTTPQAIADLLADPRTDHDTHKLEANPGRVDSKPYSTQNPS